MTEQKGKDEVLPEGPSSWPGEVVLVFGMISGSFAYGAVLGWVKNDSAICTISAICAIALGGLTVWAAVDWYKSAYIGHKVYWFKDAAKKWQYTVKGYPE